MNVIGSVDDKHRSFLENIQRYFKKPAEKYSNEVNELILEHSADVSKLNREYVHIILKQIRKNVAKEDWPEAKYMFKSIFVFLVYENNPHFRIDMALLLDQYPEYEDTDATEKALLLQFRNYFRAACEIIDPRNHKVEMVSLVGRMCGAIYIFGGGQTTATARRILIFARETKIPPRKYSIRLKETRHQDPFFVSQPSRRTGSDTNTPLSHSTMNGRIVRPAVRGVFHSLLREYCSVDGGIGSVGNDAAKEEERGRLAKRSRFEAPVPETTDTDVNTSVLRPVDNFWDPHKKSAETPPFYHPPSYACGNNKILPPQYPVQTNYSAFIYPSIHDPHRGLWGQPSPRVNDPHQPFPSLAGSLLGGGLFHARDNTIPTAQQQQYGAYGPYYVPPGHVHSITATLSGQQRNYE